MPLSKFEDIVAPVMTWLDRLHEVGGEAGRDAGIKFCAAMKSSYYGTALTGHEQTIQDLFAEIGMTIGPSKASILEACKHIFRASGGGTAALLDAFDQIRSKLPEQLGLAMGLSQRTSRAPGHGSTPPPSTAAPTSSDLPVQLTLAMAA